jgi:hypothetical protein
MEEHKVLFQGEMQLCRWSESSTNGATVTMWVHPEDLESFKLMRARTGKTPGQRLGVVIVAIGDDEAVVEHKPAASPAPELRGYRKPTLGDNALIAVRWCKSSVFQTWAARRAAQFMPEVSNLRGIRLSEDGAKQFILLACDVLKRHPDDASRKHLDADEECAKLWHERIRIPFRDYLKEEGLEP